MSVEIIRRIVGTALPLRGHNIDTDRIIPARFLRSVSFDGLEGHLFEDDRVQAGPAHPLSNPSYERAVLLLVNANFGCGSSREHAPQAIRRRGVRALVGESFSEIFFGNAVAIGLPCATVSPDGAMQLQSLAEEDPATSFALDLDAMTVSAGSLALRAAMPAAAREGFLDGGWDATGLLLDHYHEVTAVAGRLPYISGWR